MRVTIIPEDLQVSVDGVVESTLCAGDPNIHAIQWYGDYGTIEYKVGPAEHFTDASVVQPYVDAWQVVKEEKAAADIL